LLEKSLDKKKVSAQAFFCQTRESEILLDLYVYLKDKEDRSDPYLPLIFVPFFHGAYIKYGSPVNQANLASLLLEFNKLNKFRTFKIKTIEPNKSLLDEKIFSRYAVVTAYMNKLTHKKRVCLMKALGFEKEVVSENFISQVSQKAHSLKNKNKELLLEIKNLRRKIRSIPKMEAEHASATVSLEKLILECKSTYACYLSKELFETLRVASQEKVYLLRKILLEHSSTHEQLQSFVDKLTKASSNT
jgi:hypothetical protein